MLERADCAVRRRSARTHNNDVAPAKPFEVDGMRTVRAAIGRQTLERLRNRVAAIVSTTSDIPIFPSWASRKLSLVVPAKLPWDAICTRS